MSGKGGPLCGGGDSSPAMGPWAADGIGICACGIGTGCSPPWWCASCTPMSSAASSPRERVFRVYSAQSAFIRSLYFCHSACFARSHIMRSIFSCAAQRLLLTHTYQPAFQSRCSSFPGRLSETDGVHWNSSSHSCPSDDCGDRCELSAAGWPSGGKGYLASGAELSAMAFGSSPWKARVFLTSWSKTRRMQKLRHQGSVCSIRPRMLCVQYVKQRSSTRGE